MARSRIPPAQVHRRQLLAAGVGLTVAAAAVGAVAQAAGPGRVPRLEPVFSVRATIAPTEILGPVPAGVQRIISITGGSFEGPGIRGTVLPGAADWNLARSDGVNLGEANYFLRTDDGVVIKVVNESVGPRLPPPGPGEPPRTNFTTPTFEAPTGKYDWLNKSVFVGALSPDPAGGAVVVNVFKVV